MNQIYKFNEFVSIFESEKTIDNQLLDALKKRTSNRLILQWINCPEFGGVYTKSFNSDVDEVFYKWEGKEYPLPWVLYKNGEFFPKEDFTGGITRKDILDNYHSLEFNERFWRPIGNMVRISEEEADFNPFEHGVEDMPIIKDLESKGMQIVSTPREKKYGTLVLRFPSLNTNLNHEYFIQRSGYIKRRNSEWTLSTKEELIKRIYKLEDLIPKITYVYYLYLKDLAKKEGIKSFGKIISLLSSEEGTNNPIYKEEYNKIVQEYPIMAFYLPEPVGGGNKELIKGAKILGRLGIF